MGSINEQGRTRTEAVIDVTRPAFEGIESMTAEEVEALGLMVAETFLADNGHTIAASGELGRFDILAEDAEGEAVAVKVTSRRMLGCMPFEAAEPAGLDLGDLEEAAHELARTEGKGLLLGVVAVTFLSNRIAHITYAKGIGCVGGAV